MTKKRILFAKKHLALSEDDWEGGRWTEDDWCRWQWQPDGKRGGNGGQSYYPDGQSNVAYIDGDYDGEGFYGKDGHEGGDDEDDDDG